MKKGFIISWFFPPMNSSEALVTFKLLKESKYEYDVYTQNISKNWSYGNEEKKLVSKNINAIYSHKETYEEWIEEGIKYFEENKDKYDFIMSRATPKESHLLALQIKKRNPEVKWIASFGDPLSESPYEQVGESINPYSLKGKKFNEISKKYLLNPKRILKNLKWKLINRPDKELIKVKKDAKTIEKNTILNADYIIYNNKYQEKFMLRNYDKSYYKKSIILYHTFDESFYPKTENVNNDKIRITYLGHLDAIRNPYVFLQAISNLKEENPKLSEKLIVEFYGNISDSDKLFIMNNDLLDIVKIKKPVDYFTSLKIMKESDWLLLVDADLSRVLNYNVYFAAKIADYIGAHSKILAITMDEGPSKEIINDVGGVVLNYDVNNIKTTLYKIVNNKIKYKEKTANTNKYNNKVVAQYYDKFIEKM